MNQINDSVYTAIYVFITVMPPQGMGQKRDKWDLY